MLTPSSRWREREAGARFHGIDVQRRDRRASNGVRHSTLLDDEALRQRMGSIGRERVRSVLAWEHEVPRLLAAYDALEPKRAEKLA